VVVPRGFGGAVPVWGTGRWWLLDRTDGDDEGRPDERERGDLLPRPEQARGLPIAWRRRVAWT
jgi:hypothetical protein